MLLEITCGILALLGIGLFVLGLRRLWQRKLIMGGVQGLSGLFMISLAILIGAVALNLYGYHQLNAEQPVAELRFEAQAPQRFHVYVLPTNAHAQVYDLRGDEWQVDARILKWHGFAMWAGLESLYRLERLSGRYRDLAQERKAPRTVYTLDPGRGMDLWAVVKKYDQWLPWIDAVYGSAAYLPMADGAHFVVSAGASGLVARPINQAAEEILEQWR